MEQLTKPDVDFIHGLSPVIAIEQRTGTGANPRSTVATVTEIADYGRLLWAVAGEQLDPVDGAPISQRSFDDCVAEVLTRPEGSRAMILAPWMTAKASVLREELPRIRQRGYQRVRLAGEICELRGEGDELPLPKGRQEARLEVVVDRIVLRPDQRSRLADSLELAFKEGGDQATVLVQAERDGPWEEVTLSQKLAGQGSGMVYDPLTPRHFSWNHAEGACPTCGGLGHTLQFAEELVVPDPALSVKQGAIKPWRLGSKAMIIKRNAILKQLAEQLPFDPTLPWRDLGDSTRAAILHGTGERLFGFKLKRGKAEPAPEPFAGVLADLAETRRHTSSEGLRARLLAYQVASDCPDCHGARLNARARHVFVRGITFPQFLAMDVTHALALIHALRAEA
jgi:excinuclease ABC subunit A